MRGVNAFILAVLLVMGCRGPEASSAMPGSADPSGTPKAAAPQAPGGDQAVPPSASAPAGAKTVAGTGAKADAPRAGTPFAPPSSAPRATSFAKKLGDAMKGASEEMLHHTRNLLARGKPKFVNRLILETSPYLRQHAFNPVDWFPYGEEAIQRALHENKPILLSVGYATCHWCHVMARESFEDLGVAAYLNEHFISIKVDREERPDLDRVYMSVVNMLTGRGGWPMTVILTPDLKPLFGGTYFPPRDRGRRKGFLSILQKTIDEWKRDNDGSRSKASGLAQRLTRYGRTRPPEDIPPSGLGSQITAGYARSFDAEKGGFGRAPKFPSPPDLFFLVHHAWRTGSSQAEHMATKTLDAMATGGLHDFLSGGFHRYATDPQWRVPHFEKMLYDNTQLAWLYLEAYLAFGHDRFRWVAKRTLEYMARELRATDGGFVSATDADSIPAGEHAHRPMHKEEGWFFTWRPEEVIAVLGAEKGKRFNEIFNVTESGNFEQRRTILHLDGPWEGDPKAQLEAASTQVAAMDALIPVRAKRPPPETDGKRVTAWNGLAISAFARGGWWLNEPRYVRIAEETARFVLEKQWDGTRLMRTWHGGRPGGMAVLRDYAFLVQGLLDLFETTSDPKWLVHARSVQKAQDERFFHESWGGYHQLPEETSLWVRRTGDHDGAEPSGNSVSAWNLLRLAALTTDVTYERAADRLLRAYARLLNERGGALPLLVDALEARHAGFRELVLVAEEGNPASADHLARVARETFAPDIVYVTFAGASLAPLAGQVPWTSKKIAMRGKATAYLCRDRVCKRPTGAPEVLLKQIQERRD